MIPAEAIQALAVRNFDAQQEVLTESVWTWSDAPLSLQESFLSEARRQCAAVAPYMLAEAWGEGYGAGWNDCLLDIQHSDAKASTNPYDIP